MLSDFVTQTRVKTDEYSIRIKRSESRGQTLFVLKSTGVSRFTTGSMEKIRTQLSECANVSSQFAFILDLTKLIELPLNNVMFWVEFFVSIRPILKNNIVFTTFVTSLPMLHVAINFGLQVYKPIKPFYIVNDMTEMEKETWWESAFKARDQNVKKNTQRDD